MSDFSKLRRKIEEKIKDIGDIPIFKLVSNKDIKEVIKDKYLTILNDGEPIVKENKTYTCDNCLSFLNKLGDAFWFDEDNNVHTIWEIDSNEFNSDKFVKVVEKLDDIIRNFVLETDKDIEYYFAHYNRVGVEQNACIKEWNDGKVEQLTYTHLYGDVNDINVKSKGGFTKYYRYSEAVEMIEKAKEINLLIKNDIAKKLMEAVPKLEELYKNSLNRVAEIAMLNPTLQHISRDVKVSNLLITCMLKAKEDGLESAIKFAENQTKADKFMQEKAKGNSQLMREYKKLQDDGVVFTGFKQGKLSYIVINNIAKNKRAKVIAPIEIKISDFKSMIENNEIFSASLYCTEDDIKNRKSAVLEQHISETKVANDNVIVFENGYTDALFDNVKKHGGKVNAKFVFSLLFGSNADSELTNGRSISDLDLHLKSEKIHIDYSNRNTNSNGDLQLDVDMKISIDDVIDPIENIYGDFVEDGEYELYVNNFTKRFHSKFKMAIKIDNEIYETEVVDPTKKDSSVATFKFKNNEVVAIDWHIGIKNKNLSVKDRIKATYEVYPINEFSIIDDKFLIFDIGLNNKFKTNGVNKEILLSKYMQYNQTLKLMAEDIEVDAMIGYRASNKPIIEINNKIYSIKV